MAARSALSHAPSHTPRELATDKRWKDSKVAACSSTRYGEWARPLLKLFEAAPGVTMHKLMAYKEIYPGNKRRHFAKLKADSKVEVVGQVHWGVKMGHFGISGDPSNTNVCKGGCGAIVDSGTSLIAAPKEVLMQMDGFLSQVRSDCSNVDQLPNLEFTLGSGEKAEHDYNARPPPACAWIHDALAAKLVFDAAEGLAAALDVVAGEADVLRVKNRFASPTPAGYRDVTLLCRRRLGEGVFVVHGGQLFGAEGPVGERRR